MPQTLSPLTPEEKKFLLDLARNTLKTYVTTRKYDLITSAPERLMQKTAAFVYLYDGDDARGLSGTLEPTRPLVHIIQKTIIEAAVYDPQSPPLHIGEVERIRIEISILSHFKPLKDIANIELGKHGVYLTLGNKSGWVFPETAKKGNWNVNVLLTEVSQKAGLQSHAWQDKQARLQTFEKETFSSS